MTKRVDRKRRDKTEYTEKEEKGFTISRSNKEINFQLSNEQIEARQEIINNDITILIGKAGSGKSALACYTALKMLFDGTVEKIIITRPAVSTESLGFLPGGLEEKCQPWMRPIIENFYKMHNKNTVDMLLKSKFIDMLPLEYMRGITLDRTAMILDEAQNCTAQQMKMVLTRIGQGSHIIATGDLDQVDLKRPSESGLLKVKDFDIPNFKVIELENEYRKQIVIDVLEEFKKIGY